MVNAPVTRLYLVRHGQVAGARPRSYNGQLDVPLSPLGVQQMERLAGWAAAIPLTAIYSSDLQRARHGAQLVAGARGVGLAVTPALREKHFGRWEGLTYEEAERQDPEAWRAWLADPPNSRPPGGESYREVEARVMPQVRQWLREHAGRALLILAHGGVNRVVLCHALGLPLQQAFRIEQDYAALNLIEYGADGRRSVTLLNASA
jgi:alpha-ribazole phosphatase/probable phosphoglycerate mutase